MARTPTPQPPRTPGSQQASVAAAEAAQAKPVFDWNALAAPVAMATRTVPSSATVNVLESVPEPIRLRAETSLSINVERAKAVARSTAKRPRIDYHWELQQVPDEETGNLFARLIARYARYRPSEGVIPGAAANLPNGQVTARCGAVGWYVKAADGQVTPSGPVNDQAFLGVRYSVRPFERRSTTARLPGTA